MRSIKISALVAVFLAAIVAANLITSHVGPDAVYYVAFGLIGLDLITRDRLADFWGTTRWAKMLAMILMGGLLSWFINRHAATIAEASMIAFCTAELVEATVYNLLRRRPWGERAPQAAVAAAVVDSTVFISIAFGFSFEIVFLQVMCKVAGAVLWTWLIARLVPPPSMAPAFEVGT